MAKLTPADFLDERFCEWFRVSQAKRGPNVVWCCKTCAAISRTKECPAFKDQPSPTIMRGAELLRKFPRAN